MPKNLANHIQKENQPLVLHDMKFSSHALPPAWDDAIAWAKKNEVHQELLHLVRATVAWKDTVVSIGTPLSFISSKDAQQLLEEWSYNENSALLLYKLAAAVTGDQEIIQLYPPFPSEKPADQQFHGKLPTHYLIAAITQGLPQGNESDRVWLNKLKLWTLTHAITREFSDIIQDTLIREVASRIRMACNNNKVWLNLFIKLKADDTDFAAISRKLITKSESFLGGWEGEELSSLEQDLLRTLIDVARGHQSKDTKIAIESWKIDGAIDKYNLSNKALFVPEPRTIKEDDELGNPQWVEAEEDGETSHAQYEPNSNESYEHQRLQGNAILVFCTEELQYLPWSWDRPNPAELDILEEWIKINSKSHNPKSVHIAALTWVATRLGRSLRRALDLKISTLIEREWSLNTTKMSFIRLPARRQHGWQPETSEMAVWVTPSASEQELTIPSDLEKHLKDIYSKCSGATCLGDLWDKSWGKNPEQSIKEEIAAIFPRVTGSMLANVLPLRLFNSTGDHTFARLQSSHPQSALPGSCAYVSWSSEQVSNALNESVAEIHLMGSNTADNALGSLLDPIESMLIQSIKSATVKLEALRSGDDLVKFHNAYTAYHVVQLFAATGSRPIKDPFESFLYFDLSECFVYVNDKESSALRQSRIDPLPATLCQRIKEDYLDHLKALATQINKNNPQLANVIGSLTQPGTAASMPLFFFLNKDASGWESVSEKSIVSLELFDCPLPLNHFRHC